MLIYEVWIDHRTGAGSSAIQRALVGMSCIDILASTGWFLSTWAVPEGSFAFSRGNRATCTYQGFLLQLAVGAPLYNCSLALYYLLIIKYNWTEEMLAGIERRVHAVVLTFSVGTSIALIPLEQYNHIGAVCWIIGDPRDCGNSSFQSSDVPCERGNHAWLYGLALFYGPLWVCICACVSSMVFIYQEVKKTHARIQRWNRGQGDAMITLRRSAARDRSRVAAQAALYCLSFLVTWMPSTLWSIAHWFLWNTFWLDLAAAFFEPLQGFWNLLVFARQRPWTKRKIKAVLHFFFRFPCLRDDDEGERQRSVVRSSGIYSGEGTSNSVHQREEGQQELPSQPKTCQSTENSSSKGDGSSHGARQIGIKPDEGKSDVEQPVPCSLVSGTSDEVPKP